MTPCQLVKQRYPNANVKKVDKFYEVWFDCKIRNQSVYMGKGQSKKAAWKSAYRNWIH